MNNIAISSESTKFVFIGFDVHKATISACVALAFKKPRSVAVVAVARELTGFLWAALQPTDTIQASC